jgi:hypothetical protein
MQEREWKKDLSIFIGSLIYMVNIAALSPCET